jgi:methyltransferase-like protein
MKTATEQQIQNAINDFCPFGYLDMQTAVNTAIQAGKNPDYVYECVSEFAESCGVSIDKCDPVYCVMDAIMQEARNEIENKTGFDLCNDVEDGYIETHGNYMASCYNYSGNAVEELKAAIEAKELSLEDFKEATQYFLNELEIELAATAI